MPASTTCAHAVEPQHAHKNPCASTTQRSQVPAGTYTVQRQQEAWLKRCRHTPPTLHCALTSTRSQHISWPRSVRHASAAPPACAHGTGSEYCSIPPGPAIDCCTTHGQPARAGGSCCASGCRGVPQMCTQGMLPDHPTGTAWLVQAHMPLSQSYPRTAHLPRTKQQLTPAPTTDQRQHTHAHAVQGCKPGSPHHPPCRG
jgi:hypothetical protein